MYNFERMNKIVKVYVNNMVKLYAYMMKSYVLKKKVRLVAEFVTNFKLLHYKVGIEEANANIIKRS